MGTNHLIKIYIKHEGKPQLILTIYRQYDGYYSGAGVEVAYFLKRATIKSFNNTPIEDIYHANCYEALAYKFIGYLSQNTSFACVCLPNVESYYDYAYEVYFGGDEEDEKKLEPEKKKEADEKEESTEKKEEEKKQENQKEPKIPWDEKMKLKDKKMTENIIMKASPVSEEGDDKGFRGKGQEFLELYGKNYDHDKFLEQQKKYRDYFGSLLNDRQPNNIMFRFNN